jgi:demethylmenaquinone methyltransferase/2-methoxy-6-polyprenyl-1,4-benzoquinol methylase
MAADDTPNPNNPNLVETSDLEDLLAEQAHYYRERAGEYDEWWFRRGRYDHGAEFTVRWQAEVAEVEAALDRFEPTGDVLELACGTGLWTARLALKAARVTALDASEETLALARARVKEPGVSFLQADLFAWEPSANFDVCFFSFWLSHVPEERFESFWEKVARSLRKGGRVFFIDSLRSERATAVDHQLPQRGSETMLRRLDDGREFRIVKRFHEPESLGARLAELGWKAEITETSDYFLYGSARPLDG